MKHKLFEIIETNDNINTFEEAAEHLQCQADEIRKSRRDDEMVRQMETECDEQPWGIDPNINHEHDWRK